MGIESPYLLFLILIALIGAGVLFIRGRRALSYALGPIYGSTNRLLKFLAFRHLLLVIVGIAILIVPSNPYYVGKTKAVFAADMDVIILIDDSQSTTAEVGGKTRNEREKDIATDLVLQLQDANIAICEFTSKVFCRAPFGSSRNAILRTIENVDIEAIGGSGSDIKLILSRLPKEFAEGSARARVLFLISDGGEEIQREHYRRDLDMALDHFSDQGIVVMTIGVGEDYPVEIGLKLTRQRRYSGGYETIRIDEENYEIITTQLNEEKLRYIAEKTGGVYIHEDEFREVGMKVVVTSAFQEAGILRPATESLAWVLATVALACCWLYMLFFKPSLR